MGTSSSAEARTVVVGGGIAGIVAALGAAEQGHAVTLVEHAPVLGGLLRTAHEFEGLSFDHGTHVLATTGVDEIDDLVFGDDVLGAGWNRLDGLRAGNVFAGPIDGRSAFPDTRRLAPAIEAAGISDLLATSRRIDPVDLVDDLLGRFGRTFVDAIVGPALRRHLGVDDLHGIAAGTERIFELSRLIALDASTTAALKASDRELDAALAFHDRSHGRNDAVVRYPSRGGIGRWIDALTARLRARAVDIRVGTSVSSVSADGAELTLADGTRLAGDRLVWTVPPVALARMLDLPPVGPPPTMRHTTLVHLVVDIPFTTDVHYAYVHDPGFDAFRVTLYPNLGVDRRPDQHHCTVEVLADGPVEPDPLRIRDDLVAMGICSHRALVRHAHVQHAGPGFPVPTVASRQALAEVTDALRHRLPRLVLCGKATGTSFFMRDVLLDTAGAIDLLAADPVAVGAGATG